MIATDFEQVKAQARDALDRIMRGDATGYEALFAEGDDITLGNPFGGFGRGRDQVLEQLHRAASYYRDGRCMDIETISQVVAGDFAYTVEIERVTAKVGGGSEQADFGVRVTCVYRRGAAGWKLVHRHADPRVARQSAQSVLER